MEILVNYNSLFTLFYADGQIVLAENADSWSYTTVLREYYNAASLTINMTKSDCMLLEHDEIIKLQLKIEAMREVDRYM